MKKSLQTFCSLLFAGLFTIISGAASAQITYQYDFRGNFDEKNGQAPSLSSLGTGQFTAESLTDLSCLERSVYNFNQNAGVQFDNGAAGSFVSGTYSIELYFKFITNNGFMRIIDFKNRTSDFGLYATNSVLQFYDELTVGTSAFAANQYVHLVISRDGNTNDVNLYVNGSLLGTFNDADGEAIPGAANVINFFQDDLVFGGEAQPGNIALLRIDDFLLTGSQITERFNTLRQTSGAVSFVSDQTVSCLNGNIFNFTNQSATSSVVSYTWDFGDGNSSAGANASHSYGSVGIYDVVLTADDGNGCSDTATGQVEVYLAPALSLGGDFDICDGSFALLDPGASFAGYLWSDGSTDPVLLVSQAGTYGVTVTDANGCTAFDEVQIGVLPLPVFSLGADTVYCFNETVTLSAPAGLLSYEWNTGDLTADITVSSAGVYSVEVVDFDGCAASDTVVIDFYPELLISLNAPPVLCQGDTLVLDPGQNFSFYIWNDLSTQSTLTVLSDGIYSVTVTDQNGCTAGAAITVSFDVVPAIDLGPDFSICNNGPVTLDAGPGFVTYLWSDGSGAQTFDVTSPGIYSVTVSDGGSCPGSDSIVVSAEPFVSLGQDITICSGTGLTLDPGPGYASYNWSDGSVSQTITVTSSGVYTVTVSDNNGCINSDEISVSFLASPVVDLGGLIFSCAGDTIILDAGSGFSGYIWSNGSSGQTISVTTTNIFTVTVTDSNGCTASDDADVIFNDLPVVQLGNDTSICNGTVLILDAGSGFNTYQWSDGSTQQQLSVSLPGSYTVSVSDINGCIGTDTINVGTLATPVVVLGADTTLCDGDSLTLNAGTGFSSYLWNDGTSAPNLVVNISGTYTVTVTDGSGCSASSQIQIGYHPPLPIPTITQNGNTLISSSSSGNQWYSLPGGLIPGATDSTFEPGQNGTFYVVVTDSATGCVSEPSFDYIFLFDGVSEAGGLSFGLYPNPAANELNLVPGNNLYGNVNVQVADMTGKVVISLSESARSVIKLDMSALSQGVYYVKVATPQSSGVRKVVVTR